MTWEDRIKEGAYTSPSGVRFVFSYEDVSRVTTKKTTAFNFPDFDGTFVQDLGRTGSRFPLRLFFSGADYDIISQQFENALLEKGIGKLEHPFYGEFDVVPFGDITREDRLKSAANQAVFTVTFFETTRVIFPSSQLDPGSQVLQAVAEQQETQAQTFLDRINQSTVSFTTQIKNTFKQVNDVAHTALKPIADTQANVSKLFNTVFNSIDSSIDILIGTPLTLATQAIIMLKLPARATALISDRLEAYSNLASNLIQSSGDNQDIQNQTVLSKTRTERANTFQTYDVFVSTTTMGSILSVLNNTFETKVGALPSAQRS
jgi:hypothetical protein